MKRSLRNFSLGRVLPCQSCSKSQSTPCTMLMSKCSQLVNLFLWLYFPGIAQRFADCASYMHKTYRIRPRYGLYWTFCLNSPNPDSGIFRIHTCPHVDSKNLALAVCVVYVYGIFFFRFVANISIYKLRQIQFQGEVMACNMGAWPDN
jgi:hypothetical protein